MYHLYYKQSQGSILAPTSADSGSYQSKILIELSDQISATACPLCKCLNQVPTLSFYTTTRLASWYIPSCVIW